MKLDNTVCFNAMKTINIASTSQLPQAAASFINNIPDHSIIAFYGNMGVGKTTFIKAICHYLGVTDVVNSPTFAIVNEYTDDQGNPLYHFDCYRIKKLEEMIDLGYDQYFENGRFCFIEWPEMIENLLPANTLRITLSELEDGSRELRWMD